jgi:hypothetical protein
MGRHLNLGSLREHIERVTEAIVNLLQLVKVARQGPGL